MKRYEGTRAGTDLLVTVDGRRLDSRPELRNHRTTGFEWGYDSPGSAQLALALLADCLQQEERVLTLYQAFKWAVVTLLPLDYWTLTEDQIKHALRCLILPLQPRRIVKAPMRGVSTQPWADTHQGALPRFPLGYIVVTVSALSKLNENDILMALARHQAADWGETNNDDGLANTRCFVTGDRLWSIYRSISNIEFRVVTEPDRSCTAIVIPGTY